MHLTPRELTDEQYNKVWKKNDFIKSTSIEQMYRIDTEYFTSNREVYAINIDYWQCFVVEVSNGNIVAKYVISDFVVVSYQGLYRLVDLDDMLDNDGRLVDIVHPYPVNTIQNDEIEVDHEEDVNDTTNIDNTDDEDVTNSTGVSLLDFMSSDKEKYQKPNKPKGKKINPSNIRVEKPVSKVEDVEVVKPNNIEEKPKRVRLNDKPKVKEVIKKEEPINIFRQRGEAPANPMLNKDADMAMGDIFESILNR